jgi:hypothetical protein
MLLRLPRGGEIPGQECGAPHGALAAPAGIASVQPGIRTRQEQGPVLAVPHLGVRPEEEIIHQQLAPSSVEADTASQASCSDSRVRRSEKQFHGNQAGTSRKVSGTFFGLICGNAGIRDALGQPLGIQQD